MHVTKTKLVITGTVMSGVVALATAGTMARFTDSDDVTVNTFTAQTISLTLDDYTAVVAMPTMMPGQTVTAPIVVTNAAGSAALRYALTSSATTSGATEIKDALVFTVNTIDDTTPLTPCDNFDGDELYTGDLDSTNGKILGDSAQGDQAGDRDLAVGISETLCLRVSLPLATSNAYKTLATTATFTFHSEQSDYNP